MFYFRFVLLVLGTGPGTGQVINASFMNELLNKETLWNAFNATG